MAAVSLILEDLVAKTNQGNNQYTKLKQIRICNHCYHPPLFCEGTEKVDNTAYIWYNVYIKYRRCFL